MRSSFFYFSLYLWKVGSNFFSNLPMLFSTSPSNLSLCFKPPFPAGVRTSQCSAELSPSDLVTVVRLYLGKLHCPLVNLAKQQIKASSGSIFNTQPLSKAYASTLTGRNSSELLGFLKDLIILGSPQQLVNQTLQGSLRSCIFQSSL